VPQNGGGSCKLELSQKKEEVQMADEKEATKPETKDEVALEMMKFIAVTTGYGKGSTSATGFTGKSSRSPEEYAEALIQLFERCRSVLAKHPA
jgi:ATP:corrinoid adenosyltransferase